MANKNKAKGTHAETKVVRLLQAAGIDADRMPLKGNMDEGDVWCIAHFDNGRPKKRKLILEVKAGKQTHYYRRKLKEEWLRQTKVQADNAGTDGYLVIASHNRNPRDYEVWSSCGTRFWYLDDFAASIALINNTF